MIDIDKVLAKLGIADLNEIKSYEASVAYIQQVIPGNGEESAMADFLQLIEKRFA